MKRLLPLLLLASCAHKATPLPLLPIPKAVAVAPAVAAIRPGLDRASDTAARIKATTDRLAADADTARDRAAAFATETARQAAAGAVTPVDLAANAGIALDQQERLSDLRDGITSQRAQVLELSDSLAEARATQADALAAAATGDAAQQILATQLRSVTAQQQQARTEADNLRPQLAVARAGAVQFRTWLTWSLIAIGAYLSLRIAKITPWGSKILFWFP